MSEAKLDQIVKGAPPPNVVPEQLAQAARSTIPANPNNIVPPQVVVAPSDPRDTLPDSDAQKYLNLLILESSLRLQYLSLRARLRLHVLLLAALSTWTLTFTYLLFFRPREDGIGVGGSVYWVIETFEKLGWCSGIVTLCLFWATGMYERGVRWPRKFVGTANRGLRGFNMKIVVVKGSFVSELAGWLGMLDPWGWWRDERVNFQVLPKDIEATASKESWNLHAARHGLIEEDIASSGDVIKLLILPKPFSPDFREGWETYRMEYWEKENARRMELRKVIRARLREVAKRDGGWLWWTGWRGWNNARFIRSGTRRQAEMEKLALREKPMPIEAERPKEKRRRGGTLRGESHSRSSSRSSSLTPESDARLSKRAGEERARRGSSAARRPKKIGAPASSRLSATETILQDDETPPPALDKHTHLTEIACSDDDDAVKTEGSRAATPEVKIEPVEA